MPKWAKIISGTLAVAVALTLIYLIVIGFLYAKLNHHYDMIDAKMSLFEVRQRLMEDFHESEVSLEHIESDGYSLFQLNANEGVTAKKYAYNLCPSLYFYIIYDSNGRVCLKIDAYE